MAQMDPKSEAFVPVSGLPGRVAWTDCSRRGLGHGEKGKDRV